jgi:hypothetical protein
MKGLSLQKIKCADAAQFRRLEAKKRTPHGAPPPKPTRFSGLNENRGVGIDLILWVSQGNFYSLSTLEVIYFEAEL